MRWQSRAGLALMAASLFVAAPWCVTAWLAGVFLLGLGAGLGRPRPPREG